MQARDSETISIKEPSLKSRFDIIKTLGEGAVGAVYLVRDREFNNKKVALKTLVNEIDLDENTYDRFKQEILILQEINHPNIVKAYDLIEEHGRIAYTMEYVEGSDLGSLYKHHEFDYEQIESIVVQVLSALSALHSKGIWHRDIKLENIILSKDGSVKLADLGLVKNEFNKDFTKTGVLLGTAQYMPPEYVMKAKYDARGDIYAVGVVLFELLRKRRRYPNQPGNKIIEMLIKHNFEVPQEELLGIPQHLVKIVNQSVQPDLSQRFQSAEEMIKAFESADYNKIQDEQLSMCSTINMSQLREEQKGSSSKVKYLWYGVGLIAIVAACAVYFTA